jgi:putative transposase
VRALRSRPPLKPKVGWKIDLTPRLSSLSINMGNAADRVAASRRPAALLDWATRRVLSWRLSITMEAAFRVETLEDALARHGKPEIFNTDQGSQFTGSAFTGLLADHGIAISMDGKGAWRDNVFVERLWRSIKYEEVYLRAYETVGEARSSIGRYLDFYNGRRPHSSLDDRTPDQAYFDLPPLRAAA